MDVSSPRMRIRLLKDYTPVDGQPATLSDLRALLAADPAFENIELSAEGNSTVVAVVPARNQRQKDRFKLLLDKALRGWSVIEDNSYRAPATF